MESIKTYSIPIKNFTLEGGSNSQFLKTKFFAISEGDNLNQSAFDLSGIEECMSTNDYEFKPILGSWDKEKVSDIGFGDFGGHDSDLEYDVMSGETYNTYLGEKNERPLGVILPNTAKIEEFKNRKWLTFEGVIWAEYNREAIRLLKKKRSNNVSVEIRVVESHNDERNIEIIEKFTLLGITIIGVDAGIPNAHLDLLEFSRTDKCNQFVRAFSREIDKIGESKEMELKFLKSEDFGSGAPLKLDLSKESASDDKWGPVNKTKLRNDLLRAKNYKTLIPKSYLVVNEGWQDSPSENLKYPIVQIKDGKVVLNINGVETAGAYLMKEKGEPYFKTAKAKLNKVRRLLGKEKLMTLEFGVETNDDWGISVEQNQPNIIKMGKGGNLMKKSEFLSKVKEMAADIKAYEEEITKCASIYEEKVGDYEYAEEENKEMALKAMEDAKADKDKKEMELSDKEKSIIDIIRSADELEDDEDEKDNKKYPEIDDIEEEEPVDTEDDDKYAKAFGEGIAMIGRSKNYITYEKDGKIYAQKYECGEDGAVKFIEDEKTCEKMYAQIVVGGPLNKEDNLPYPPALVEMTSGINKMFVDIKEKDKKIGELMKEIEETKAKLTELEKEQERYKLDVKSMLTTYEEVTKDEQVPEEYAKEIKDKILESKFADVKDLEMNLKAHLYELNKGKILSGNFAKKEQFSSGELTEQQEIENIINQYKK